MPSLVALENAIDRILEQHGKLTYDGEAFYGSVTFHFKDGYREDLTDIKQTRKNKAGKKCD